MKKMIHTAKRRYASVRGGTEDAEAERRALGAAVLADPGRIVDASWHTVRGRFEIAPHHHHDVMQLDLIQQCEGSATIGDRETTLHGSTLMVTPPGERHGYSLRPAGDDAAVWLVKLRFQPRPSGAGPRPADTIFPPVVTGLASQSGLRGLLDDFIRGWTPQGVGLIALARLITALSVWPTDATVGGFDSPRPEASNASDSPSARVKRAVEHLGKRISEPPDLSELAAAAHLSPRHFARRFKRDYGSTPHEYLQARRLDVARGLLRDTERRVASVAEELGFSSPAAFSRWFTRLAGRSPRHFRQDPENY